MNGSGLTDDSAGIDDLLRRLTGDPVPGADTFEAGRMRLMAAIHRESTVVASTRRSTTPWLRRVAVAAIVVVMALAVSVLTPTEVTALGVLAEVAETVAPTVGSDGQYVYRVTDQVGLESVERADLGMAGGGEVFYLRSVQVHTWETADVVREDVIVGSVVFFDPVAQAAYPASPLAGRESPGAVITSERERPPFELDVRVWPTSPEALRAAMEVYPYNEPGTTPQAVRVMGLAASLLRDPRIEAPLRAAVIRVLDELTGVEVVHLGDGAIASLRYTAPPGGATILELEFDGQARLIRETYVWADGLESLGVPPGTVVNERRYGVPMMVDSIG